MCVRLCAYVCILVDVLFFAEDFPNGSWLGDENDVENRVRVNISPRS